MTVNEYIEQYKKQECQTYGDILNPQVHLTREESEIYNFIKQSDRNRLLHENKNLIEV